MDETAADAPKTYVGFIWVDDQPGIRLSVGAHSPEEATAAVDAQFGKGHVVSLWSQEDAARSRGSSGA